MQLGEQTGRQDTVGEGVIVPIADAAQVGARLVEQVAFRENDPRAFGIEAEMALDGLGQFKRAWDTVRRAVGDRHDQNLRFSVLIESRQDEGAGPILDAFLAASPQLAQLQIRIPDDEADLRLRQRYGVRSVRRSSRWS